MVLTYSIKLFITSIDLEGKFKAAIARNVLFKDATNVHTSIQVRLTWSLSYIVYRFRGTLSTNDGGSKDHNMFHRSRELSNQDGGQDTLITGM